MAVTHSPQASHEHADPLKSYLIVFVTLMFLLCLTVCAYYIPFEKLTADGSWGFLNTAIALIIATIKAGLVVLVFMHLRHGTKLTWVIASTGFIWLCIMITFFFADYLSRSDIPEGVHGADPNSINLKLPPVVHQDPAPFNGMG
jgi:cytochrome c oxidase subunit 4